MEGYNFRKKMKTVSLISLDDIGFDYQKNYVLSILVLKNTVFFPNRLYQMDITLDQEKEVIDHVFSVNNDLFLVAQNPESTLGEPYEVGVIAQVTDRIVIQDGGYRVVFRVICRGKKIGNAEEQKVTVAPLSEVKFEDPDKMVSVKHTVIRSFEKYLSIMNHRPIELENRLLKIDDPGRLIDLIADNLPVEISLKQEILETNIVEERFGKLLFLLHRETGIALLQKEMEEKLHEKLNKNQKEYVLREQMKLIQTELGEDQEQENEIQEWKKRLHSLKLPKSVNKKVSREIDRYSRMNGTSAEGSVARTYIQWILDLPWKSLTKDEHDLRKAESILEEDHYGLKKVKERILEYLAVRSLNKNMKGQIICLFGPPGVGKTSIGRSIARSMNRKFVRMSLGGIRDEAEIRGHRRTYVGAIPGRIINCIKEAGTKNPVVLLDEIDKLAGDFRGDPAGALLEVLDPEQNKEFTDHYLEIPFDLSKVIFIATANRLSTIPKPLLDRMEVIEITGYTEEEKLHIAQKYLIPKQMEEHGIKGTAFSVGDAALLSLIRNYTRESGVRELERKIAELCRKIAVRIVKKEGKVSAITERNLVKYLGKKKYKFDLVAEEDQVGIVTGLAWTSVGGETLSVEVNVLDGGSGKLKITGQIGDVMKESAEAALSFVRTVSKDYKISEELFKTKDIHIHIPEGAIPKDGPSAGVTMATALISALSNTRVSRYVAMTGEVTLRGRVLPIGGLKEKSLAAMRAGITTVLFPFENKSDYEELPEVVKTSIHFIPVKNMKQVLKHSLVS